MQRAFNFYFVMESAKERIIKKIAREVKIESSFVKNVIKVI